MAPLKKGGGEEEVLSEEEIEAREQVATCLSDIEDSNPQVRNLALERMRRNIQRLSSLTTSIPKPMMLLKPHYGVLTSYFETAPNSLWKKDLADILSVLALLCLTAEGETESFKYRLQGSEDDITSWGGKCMRQKLVEITEKVSRLKRESVLKQPEDDSDSQKEEDEDARPVGALRPTSPPSPSASAPLCITEKGSTSNGSVPLAVYFDLALQEQLLKYIKLQKPLTSAEPAEPAAPTAAEASKQFRAEAQRDARLNRRKQLQLKRLINWSKEQRRAIDAANKRVRMEVKPMKVSDIRLKRVEGTNKVLGKQSEGEALVEGGEEPVPEDEGGQAADGNNKGV